LSFQKESGFKVKKPPTHALKRLRHKSVHGSTSSPRTNRGTLKIN
jgi:hypothetical protein